MDQNSLGSDQYPKRSNKDIALEWANAGFPVFPCRPRREGEQKVKAPYTPNGFYDAATCLTKIETWWKEWPEALVGMPTGSKIGISIIDGDIDRDTGEAVGEAQIEALGLAHQLAVQVRTASGGVHLYFTHVEGARCSSHQVASNIDTRGDGGYVIVPGTVLPDGSSYHFIGRSLTDALEAGDMPPYPLEAIRAAIAQQKTAEGGQISHTHTSSLEPNSATPQETLLAAKAALVTASNDLAREDWVKLAASLQAEFGTALHEDFIKFSLKYAKGDCTHAAADHVWKSAKPKTVTNIGPAFPLLRQAMTEEAWRKIWRDVFRDRDTGQGSKVSDRITTAAAASQDGAPTADPVDLWGKFDPPLMPEGILPNILEVFARVNASHMGADPSGLAVAALATCSAAIRDNICIKLKRHGVWMESARIWAALIGPPSTKKSPIIDTATAPLCKLDCEMVKAWQQRVLAYEKLSNEEKKGRPRPPQTRLRIEDATIEATQEVLIGSPWGVLLLQDELSGFFGAMDKYNGGRGAQADRAFWLRSFNGGQYALNRVGRGVALIENLSISMLGGIQPEPMRKIAAESVDDGLLQRLFPIMLTRATIGRDEPMPPVNNQYEVLIRHLHKLQPPGFTNAGVLEFDDGALAIREELEAKHLKMQELETVTSKLGSHIGKYDGLFGRLCVIWHCVEHLERTLLSGEQRNGLAPLPAVVTASVAQRVAAFMHQFLLPHAFAFYSGVLGLSDDHDRLTAIAGYILTHKPHYITNRDVQRGDRTMRGLKDHEIRPLLEQLDALCWLERMEPLRPSSPPHWQVNPKVHAKFADRAAREAYRRQEARATIQRLVQK